MCLKPFRDIKYVEFFKMCLQNQCFYQMCLRDNLADCADYGGLVTPIVFLITLYTNVLYELPCIQTPILYHPV